MLINLTDIARYPARCLAESRRMSRDPAGCLAIFPGLPLCLPAGLAGVLRPNTLTRVLDNEQATMVDYQWTNAIPRLLKPRTISSRYLWALQRHHRSLIEEVMEL